MGRLIMLHPQSTVHVIILYYTRRYRRSLWRVDPPCIGQSLVITGDVVGRLYVFQLRFSSIFHRNTPISSINDVWKGYKSDIHLLLLLLSLIVPPVGFHRS